MANINVFLLLQAWSLLLSQPRSMQKQLMVNFDVPAAFRVNQSLRNSDGFAVADFVGCDLGLETIRGFSTPKLIKNSGSFVNYALSSATQVTNILVEFAGPIVPAPPTGAASVTDEVVNFCNTIDNSPMVSVKDEDVFVMDNVGANDVLLTATIAFQLGLTGAALNGFIDAQKDIYVDAFSANIDTLYNKGMRNLFLAIQTNAKWQLVYEKTGGLIALGLAQLIYDTFQNALQTEIDTKKASTWTELQLFIGDMNVINQEIEDNADFNGVVLPITDTQVDLGAWPVSDSAPTGQVSNAFFVDDTHPTQHTHRLLADTYIKWLKPLNRSLFC